tara:strand:- start:13651 stop:14358 length:708 start_codon:yes stop_codon:yes gene_type:complete
MKRIVYRTDDTIQVFRLGTTSNDKIEADKKRKIVQTYTFSLSQMKNIMKNVKGMKKFFSVADSNCMDCPFNKFGKCYTHKFNQYVGFISMIKSIIKEYDSFENIPTYNDDLHGQIVDICRDTYVRFGTYGEPSLHPLKLIDNIVEVASNWTGYTHQWHRNKELSKYFMASTHTAKQEQKARSFGYRSFVVTNDKLKQYVNCPASKEAGYKSSCSKCGLCSGTNGKTNKSIYILNH